MDKIDLRLLMTQQALVENRLPREAFESAGVAVGTGTRAGPQLRVIVQFTGPIAPLEAAGFRPASRVDDLATGTIAPAQLGALAALPSVVRIEGDAPMEAQLDRSVADVNGDDVNRAPGVGTPPTVYTGNGVIVGVIDSGIDFRHEAFLRADGTSRLLAIWDQNLPPTGTEAAPQPYTYGVEYNRAAINADLAGTSPGTVRHRDTNGHGTHVAGIAAGGGTAFPGMAPGADIVAVRANLSRITTIDAMKYILDMAKGLSRPVVINQSQGFLQGPHDGTTLTEIFIDRLLGSPGQAYVVAAGNFAADQIYNTATITAGGSATMSFSIASPQAQVSVEVWYRAGDSLSVTLATPAGALHGPHAQPASGTQTTQATTAGGTVIDVARRTDEPANHHNQIQLLLVNAGGVETGSWHITLANAGTRPITVHAWVERSGGNVRFVGGPAGGVSSISMPGSAREAIAVGSYVTRLRTGSAPLQAISNFSSLGPTLDGRIKPDITAPGEDIVSARSSDPTAANPAFPAGGGRYTLMSGTSMATPHVAGAVACLLQKRPTLTQEQIRNGLARTARADAQTGPANGLPNNPWGRGKLDTKALLEYNFPAAETRTWARVRSILYNWTESATPAAFEVISNENGRAVIELAWGSGDIPVPPALDPAAPLRYYNTGERFNHSVTKADGSTVALDIPEQTITLRDNRAVWTMPQALWDAYREELKKARKTPPTSQMRQMLYYRVRFEPTGAASAVIWPDDSSFNASPLNNRMGIIALNMSPSTQVPPDREAIQAMPRFATELEWMWSHLPAGNPDKIALTTLFSHRFFTNHVEKEIRGKILTLWVQAGPARQRIHTLLDRMFRTSSGIEMTVFKQPSIRDNTMLIDHLLELVKVVPHPDMTGVRVAEQLLDDVLREIMDPNGQVNQGQASTCAPTGIQTLLLNTNASEYARLMRGLLSAQGQATLANGDAISPPPGIFRAANYAGAQSSGFYVRTYAELAFQATILKYARGNDFPRYDPDAPPNDTRGINTVFQATIRQGLTFDQIKKALDALLNRNHTKTVESAPSAALRSGLLAKLQGARDPILTVLHWSAPPTAAGTGLHAVVALRTESGRIFFKNPQYAGSGAPASMVPNSTVQNPPRRLDDPRQALESMGDNDLSGWVRGFYAPA
ncbi:MAG: S8 family serine peptidase [Gammaproteobacteria bacterium]